MYAIKSGQRVRSPGYQKFCARVIHIRDNRGGQLNRSAMEKPRPGGTALLITVTPTPGKYDLVCFLVLFISQFNVYI